MIRILGVICGAAISIGALTWFVGVPQFTSERVVNESPVLPLVAAEPVAENDKPEETVDTTAPDSTEAPPEHAPEFVVAADEMVTVEETAPVFEPPIEMALTPEPVLNWFAFWSPFRSEIAANGFVGELQRVTGLDYRVVKVKPGVYEVAFAYAEDDEISSNLSTISAATGLNLPSTR